MKQRRWAMLAWFVIIHCSLFISHATAQTFTQRLQQHVNGEGVITIHQDQAIDKLVNGPHATPAPAESTVEKKKTTAAKTARQPKKSSDRRPTANRLQTDSVGTGEPLLETDTIGKPRRSYRTTGYRVQVFSGGNSRSDRQRAEHTGNQLRTLFPEHQVYVHFYSPRWICRIGNFKSYEDANKLRNELKELGYKTATIVKGKIILSY